MSKFVRLERGGADASADQVQLMEDLCPSLSLNLILEMKGS